MHSTITKLYLPAPDDGQTEFTRVWCVSLSDNYETTLRCQYWSTLCQRRPRHWKKWEKLLIFTCQMGMAGLSLPGCNVFGCLIISEWRWDADTKVLCVGKSQGIEGTWETLGSDSGKTWSCRSRCGNVSHLTFGFMPVVLCQMFCTELLWI